MWRSQRAEPATLSGYVEGESLHLAAPSPGYVASLAVDRGDRVEAGAPLFVMDARTAGAQQDEARAAVVQAETQADAAAAQYRQAVASAEAVRAVAAGARTTADRLAGLRRASPGAIAVEEVDRAEADALAKEAQAEAARRQAAAAAAQAAAAQAQTARAGAGLSEVGVRLDLLAPRAPAAGRIEQVFFREGEWAGANQPVVSLLPDERIKLRFFVPATSVALYRTGREIRFTCDSCGAERRAVVTYVAPRAEFTPPVIYSRDARERLVFLVEARPADPASLTPGLPVDVTPLEPER
jgi:HlyD family secretion protein